jgi:hypothetical protein
VAVEVISIEPNTQVIKHKYYCYCIVISPERIRCEITWAKRTLNEGPSVQTVLLCPLTRILRISNLDTKCSYRY